MSPAPSSLHRPDPQECPSYYGPYVDRVPDGDIAQTLATQIDDTIRPLRAVPFERERFRPREDAWSIREVVGHVIDTERVMVFRALSMARGDPAPLPSMEQDAWARLSNAGDRPLTDLVDELDAVRRATVLFFAGLDAPGSSRSGTATGFDFTVRSFPWIIAGHELHHRALLLETYGVGA